VTTSLVAFFQGWGRGKAEGDRRWGRLGGRFSPWGRKWFVGRRLNQKARRAFPDHSWRERKKRHEKVVEVNTLSNRPKRLEKRGIRKVAHSEPLANSGRKK